MEHGGNVDERLAYLVEGFGDAGKRILQVFGGKLTGTLPESLRIHSVMLSGRSGIGKSLLLTEIAQHFDCNIVKVHLGRVMAAGGQHNGLRQILTRIPADRSSLVWLVDIELFCGLYGRVVEDFIERVKSLPLCLVAMTTRLPQRIHASLRLVCDDHVCLLPPGKLERQQLCRWYAGSEATPEMIESAASLTAGNTVSELFANIADRLQPRHNLNRGSSTTSASDSAVLKSSTTNVHWKDIGGLEKVIEELKETIVWPLLYRDEFARLGITPSRGVLLYGPPGTGKTMLARAAATEVSANFILVAIPDLIKGEVGESEKALTAIFANAARSPSIVFLDEIEAIFGSREQSGEVGKKLITQLFLEMDNIPEDASVVILAATNAPHLMDSSILRSGRLDKKIHIPRPDYSSRLDILTRATQNLSIENATELLAQLAETEMSGAEIKSLVRCACYSAIQRGTKVLCRQDFDIALATASAVDQFADMQ
ncbi:hypothetical protein H4S07_000651 [Coemansia furcata]|uniref:Uncharacterized protein n=1 Tax=Coemansia furcata TaxID=417177 RepID=A0ACC1LQI9_9FUNG|nr:hypothetical protein H4S07_000651 [Coemansia furcata]